MSLALFCDSLTLSSASYNTFILTTCGSGMAGRGYRPGDFERGLGERLVVFIALYISVWFVA